MVKETSRIVNYIENSINKIPPRDRGDVRRYLEDLAAQAYSESRMFKIASIISKISEKLSFKDADAKDVKRFVAQLERSDYASWTKYGYKSILRQYMRWLGRAEAVDWIKPKPPKNRAQPEEVLTEEDVKAVAGAAYTTRDKAFVLGLYESGTRIGEFRPLRIKHLSFDRHGVVILLPKNMEGLKTGQRRIRLVASTLALQRWLEEHPCKDDPEAYLWCKIPTANNPKKKTRPLGYEFIRSLLKELGAKSGVKKKTNPHAFRHARATFLARHLKEPEMRAFFGWGSDSEMPSVYVHLSGRDVDNSVLAVYGIKEAQVKQAPVLSVERCPRCQEQNDPAARFCGKCGLPITLEATRQEGEREDFIEKKIKELILEYFREQKQASEKAKSCYAVAR